MRNRKDIFRKLNLIRDRPADVAANMTEPVFLLRQSGKEDQVFNPKKPKEGEALNRRSRQKQYPKGKESLFGEV